jgi:hypothetical protein
MELKKESRPLARKAASQNYQASFYQKRSWGQVKFNRAVLPSPLVYLTSQGICITGKGEWRDAICPFHQDSHPSLRINVNSGGFRCMACGAHGCDILSFHMQRHKLDFVAAAKSLGVWGQS